MMDDRDLDDAELWAVIDSAVSRSRFSATAIKPIRNPKQQQIVAAGVVRAPIDGEVVQGDRFHRPQKAARLMEPSCSSTVMDRQMVVVRQASAPHQVRSPVFSSPDPTKFPVKEVQMSPLVESPASDHWEDREKGDRSSHCLLGQFPSVSQFKEFQNASMQILEKSDYTMISGNPYIKKSGWRKIAFFFNISFEIKDKSIEYDENMNVLRAEFIARAHMKGGRFSDGWGSCDKREKRFQRPNNDVPSTAETRAKNRACQDLLGIGMQRHGTSHGPY